MTLRSKHGTAVKARQASGGGMAELERLRPMCLGMPGAVERLSHGEPTWAVSQAGRVFAMFDNHHHGAAHVSVWVAAPMEAQQALVVAQPSRYWVPPYVGHRGWVAIILDTGPDWAEIAALVREAFRLVSSPTPRGRSQTVRARLSRGR